MHNLISKYNVILELGRDEERELSLQLGGRKTFLSSPPPHKLYAGSNKRQNQYPDLRSHSWYNTLQLWTELLQIKQAQGFLWQMLPSKTVAGLYDGSINMFSEKKPFWHPLPPFSPHPPTRAPQLMPDIYLQPVGQGCESWAGKCYSSWDCCGGRQNFHLVGDGA